MTIVTIGFELCHTEITWPRGNWNSAGELSCFALQFLASL